MDKDFNIQNREESLMKIISNTDFIKLVFLICTLFILLNCNSVEAQAVSTIKPLAIMVGNSFEEISHQTGLSKADIVYEANVEFPYTRLMAVFLNNCSTTVGPIRSSRYYFSRIAAEWSPIYAHCGGQILKDERITNLDQMRYAYPYWRDKKIGGWINLFADTKKIREKSNQLGNLDKVNLENNFLNFRETNLTGGDIHKIAIKYNQKYSVSYEYDINNKIYYRSINDVLYKDSYTSEPLNVSNIIIQYVPVNKILGDKEGRLQIELIGEGVAKLFSGGHFILAKWTKESKNHNTLFYDNMGELLRLNKGQTWIEIVPKETKIWIK